MQGHSAHQLARPNFAFVPVLRRSNPGCAITILTDQATQFAGLPPGVQVFRYALDRARMGRNAWANYYQFRAQQARPDQRGSVPPLLRSGSGLSGHVESFCVHGFFSVAPDCAKACSSE